MLEASNFADLQIDDPVTSVLYGDGKVVSNTSKVNHSQYPIWVSFTDRNNVEQTFKYTAEGFSNHGHFHPELIPHQSGLAKAYRVARANRE